MATVLKFALKPKLKRNVVYQCQRNASIFMCSLNPHNIYCKNNIWYSNNNTNNTNIIMNHYLSKHLYSSSKKYGGTDSDDDDSDDDDEYSDDNDDDEDEGSDDDDESSDEIDNNELEQKQNKREVFRIKSTAQWKTSDVNKLHNDMELQLSNLLAQEQRKSQRLFTRGNYIVNTNPNYNQYDQNNFMMIQEIPSNNNNNNLYNTQIPTENLKMIDEIQSVNQQ
mmetsp:Transcript_88312/g.108121  ORF Transcript_88312/g.108121 Transcript_88312/m.108121 type:complete len:223 (+) Transcript_88312:37-705(+)